MRARISLLLTAAIVLLGSSVARATTYTWVNTTGINNSWNISTNWNPVGIPGANDSAIITNDGSAVVMTTTTSVSNIVLGAASGCASGLGETLAINGQGFYLYGLFAINSPCGSFTLDSGFLDGATTNATIGGPITLSAPGIFAGTLNIATNGSLNITTASDHDIPSVTLNNYGSVTWNGGRIRGGGIPGTLINNYGAWDSQGDLTFNSDFNGDGFIFKNAGTFLKSAGTNSTLFSSVVFNNSGVVNVETGTLNLSAGGVFSGGSETGDGTLLLAAGGFTIDGMTTTTNCVEAGGILYGDNVINGAFVWSSGAWYNANSVTVETNSLLNITSGSDHDISYLTFTNYGTVAWSGPGRVRGGGIPGTTIYNYGLWDSQGDWTLNDDYGNDGTELFNYGTFRKSAGTNATTITGGVYVENMGTMDVETGTLSLNGGGILSDGSETGNGTLLLAAGGFTIAGMTSTTNLVEAGGVLYGDNVINGGLVWSSGVWNNADSVTVATNTVLNITSASDHNMAYITFTNYGTVAWSGPGRVRGGGIPGTTLYNYGLWDSQGDWTLNDDYGNDGTILFNFGTFRKSAGTNATTLTGGVYVENMGTMDVETGTLSLNGGGLLNGGIQTGPGLYLLAGGGFTINGMTTTANVQLNGGTLVGSNVFAGGLTWVAGNWDSATSVTIPTNTFLNVTSGNDHDMASCLLNNYGTVSWSAGRIRGGGDPATVINNYGLFDSQADLTMNSDLGLNGLVFKNIGVFLKSGGTNSTVLSPSGGAATFNTTGLVNVATTGSLVLNGGGSLSGGSFTGTGLLYLDGGNFNLNGMITTTNVQETGGNLSGANMVNGALVWSSGNWDSATSVTITSNSVLNIVSAADHDMASCTVSNLGTVDWQAGLIRGGGNPGTFIYNYGLWNAQTDSTFNSDLGLNGFVFKNFGAFQKSAGVGSTVFNPSGGSAAFNNTGTVTTPGGGTIYFNGGGVWTGGSVSGNVLLNGGYFTINGTATTTTVQETGGLLAGSNVLAGGFTWSSGNWNSASSVTVAANSELDITSAANHDMANCTLANNGKVEWIAGPIRGGSNPGSTINNNNLWEVQCDYALNSDLGLNGIVFNNNGKFRKFGTTGATTFSPSGGTAAFNILGGSIELDSGTLSIPGPISSSIPGGLTIGLGGTNSGQSGKLVAGSFANLGGPLTVILTNGFQSSTPEQFTIVSSVADSGSFSPVTLPYGLTVNYTNPYVLLLATNIGPVQILTPILVGSNMVFGFQTVNGQSYTIQSNTNLDTTNWLFYSNFTGDGTLRQFTVPVTNSVPQDFFRVREP